MCSSVSYSTLTNHGSALTPSAIAVMRFRQLMCTREVCGLHSPAGDPVEGAKMRAVSRPTGMARPSDQVMAATGCSRGSVSGYLNELERRPGCQIVRGNRRALKTDGLQAERENGKRRASVRDFHCSGSPGSPSPWPPGSRSNWFSASPATARSRS